MTDPIEELLTEGEAFGAVRGKMFGADALLLNGKAVVCAKRDMLGFKLGNGTDAHSAALTLPGAELLTRQVSIDPSEIGWRSPRSRLMQPRRCWVRRSRTLPPTTSSRGAAATPRPEELR